MKNLTLILIIALIVISIGCSFKQINDLSVDDENLRLCDLDSFSISLPQVRITRESELAKKIDSIYNKLNEVTAGSTPPFIRVDTHLQDSFTIYKISITRAYTMEFCKYGTSCELVQDTGLGVFWHKGILVKLNGTLDSYFFTSTAEKQKSFVESVGNDTAFYSYVCLDNNGKPKLDLSLKTASYYREINGNLTLYYSK